MGKKGRSERPAAGAKTEGAKGSVYTLRSNDEIIGHISGDTTPTHQVKNELKKRLAYEISSPEHQEVLAKVQGGGHPITYETPGMLGAAAIRGGFETRLIFGLSATATFSFADLPSGAVHVLSDSADVGTGESRPSGTEHPWPAGTRCLMLALEQESIVHEGSEQLPAAAAETARCSFIFVGECNFVSDDLWQLAVLFRKGQSSFKWPGFFAAIQCPFCAKLAEPDDRRKKSWIMLSQDCQQLEDGCTAGQRFSMRLACKACFVRKLPGLGGSISYPGILMAGACAVVSQCNAQLSVPELTRVAARQTQPAPSVYELNGVFQTSGMFGACVRHRTTSKVESTGGKSRVSKSMSAHNGGQDTVQLVPDGAKEMRCDHCHATKKTAAASKKLSALEACSGCSRVWYCGKQCQAAGWEGHKAACKAAQERK